MNTSRIMGSVRRVVIDANVLIYLAVANLLLDLARREGLFKPCWSQQVLDETFRTVAVKFGRGVLHAATRLAEITVGFPDALQSDLEPIIGQCTNDAKDRHVLAAAIKAEARVIVTFNQKHFRPEHLERWGIVAMHPNDFLLELYTENPDAVGRQLKFAAVKKRMEVGDLVASYSEQLHGFRTALLAKLP